MKQLAMYISKYLHTNTEEHKTEANPHSNHPEITEAQPKRQSDFHMPNTISTILNRAKPQSSNRDVQKNFSSLSRLNSMKFTNEASEWDSDDFSQPEMTPEEIMNRLITPMKSCISFDDRPLSSLINVERAYNTAMAASSNDLQNLLLQQEKAALLNFLHQQQAEMHIEITELMNEKKSLGTQIEKTEILNELYNEDYIVKQVTKENNLQHLSTQEQTLDSGLITLQQDFEQIFNKIAETKFNDEKSVGTIKILQTEMEKIEQDMINSKNNLDIEIKNKIKERRLIFAKNEEFAVQHEILRETVEQLKENNKHLRHKTDQMQHRHEAGSNGVDLISREIEIAKLQLQTAHNRQKSISDAIIDLDRDFSMRSSEESCNKEQYNNEILDVRSISRSSSIKDDLDDSFLNTVVIKQGPEDTLNLTGDLHELSDQINILEELVEIRNEILKEYQCLSKEDWIHRTALRSELAKANYQISEIQSFIRNKAIVFP